MDDVCFKAAAACGKKQGAAGKGMAVRPAVKPAHNVFLDKYNVKALQKIPQSRRLHPAGKDQKTCSGIDPPDKIADLMGSDIFERSGGKTKESASGPYQSSQSLFTTYIYPDLKPS